MSFYLRGLITELCKIDREHVMRFAGITLGKIGNGILYRVKKSCKSCVYSNRLFLFQCACPDGNCITKDLSNFKGIE